MRSLVRNTDGRLPTQFLFRERDSRIRILGIAVVGEHVERQGLEIECHGDFDGCVEGVIDGCGGWIREAG